MLALIETAMTADLRYSDKTVDIDDMKEAGVSVPAADRIALDVLADAWSDARHAVFVSQPKTIQGVRAIFEYLKRDAYLDQDDFELLIDSMLRCPALAKGA